MSMERFYCVEVVPKREKDFSPHALGYFKSYEKAEATKRWYINDHGLTFKKNGKHYPALVQIRRTDDPLPDGDFLLTVKEIKK